jgi:hypothetical protein
LKSAFIIRLLIGALLVYAGEKPHKHVLVIQLLLRKVLRAHEF